VLIFIYSLARLLIRFAIGMHYYQSRASAIWISLAASAPIVVNEFSTAFLFSLLTLRRFQKEQRNQSPK
jgi:hypothetical protein